MILTPRQTEVAALLHGGRTPKQIARELGISENTVGMHITMGGLKVATLGWAGRPAILLVRYYERFHVKPHAPSLKNAS